LEITASEAVKAGVTPKPKLGNSVKISKNPEDFGRIAAQTARQVIIQRLKDAERQIVFEEFAKHIGKNVDLLCDINCVFN